MVQQKGNINQLDESRTRIAMHKAEENARRRLSLFDLTEKISLLCATVIVPLLIGVGVSAGWPSFWLWLFGLLQVGLVVFTFYFSHSSDEHFALQDLYNSYQGMTSYAKEVTDSYNKVCDALSLTKEHTEATIEVLYLAIHELNNNKLDIKPKSLEEFQGGLDLFLSSAVDNFDALFQVKSRFIKAELKTFRLFLFDAEMDTLSPVYKYNSNKSIKSYSRSWPAREGFLWSVYSEARPLIKANIMTDNAIETDGDTSKLTDRDYYRSAVGAPVLDLDNEKKSAHPLGVIIITSSREDEFPSGEHTTQGTSKPELACQLLCRLVSMYIQRCGLKLDNSGDCDVLFNEIRSKNNE